MTNDLTPQQRLEEEVEKLKANLDRLETSLKALNVDLMEIRFDMEQIERVFRDYRATIPWRGED